MGFVFYRLFSHMSKRYLRGMPYVMLSGGIMRPASFLKTGFGRLEMIQP